MQAALLKLVLKLFSTKKMKRRQRERKKKKGKANKI